MKQSTSSSSFLAYGIRFRMCEWQFRFTYWLIRLWRSREIEYEVESVGGLWWMVGILIRSVLNARVKP
jgi:hypothetical protein